MQFSSKIQDNDSRAYYRAMHTYEEIEESVTEDGRKLLQKRIKAIFSSVLRVIYNKVQVSLQTRKYLQFFTMDDCGFDTASVPLSKLVCKYLRICNKNSCFMRREFWTQLNHPIL